MAREGMNRVHEQFENPSKQDVDDVLLSIRHVERRLLERLEGLDDRVASLNERIDNLAEGIAKQENAIERLEQTVKTKVQKPAATPRKETGA
jgi:prefoldin subunit 5